jgi:Aconitase family (aconitate hydratase)
VLVHCTTDPDFGGLGLSLDQVLSEAQDSEVLFLTNAHLESLNSQDRCSSPLKPRSSRPVGRRPMTLSEKIFAAHDILRSGSVAPGQVIRVDIDWILASELSWAGMEKIYNSLNKPGIFRNDRVWLAGDHVVDPRALQHPRIKPLVEASERARRAFNMTEYQGMNYTIMHTEFCRERAQPGMLVLGSDSHTCSAGSVSALAIGLGAADVTLALVTGQTWFRVPETVEIRFVGRPKPGLGGKDVILYVLKCLRRNTVAADRVVEYTGPGLEHLSCDARFAIANMTTVGRLRVRLWDGTQDLLSNSRNLVASRGSLSQMPSQRPSSAAARIPSTGGSRSTTSQTKTHNTPKRTSLTWTKSSHS